MNSEAPVELCSHLPLSQAVLCVQCETIYSAAVPQCPSCTSRCVLVLARVLAWDKKIMKEIQAPW